MEHESTAAGFTPPTSPTSFSEVTIDVNGERHNGRYRVLPHTVVVYYGTATKFADTAPNNPELVARWLMRDLVAAAQLSARPGLPL